jgi:hypothetical protein
MENENKGAVRVEGNKTPRLTFSVSREFESILPEIESMPNMSRFVCEAIYEKLQRTKNPNKDLEDALSHFVQIQSIIGRPVVSESSQPQWTPNVQTQSVPPTSTSMQTAHSSVSVQETEKSTPAPTELSAEDEQEETLEEPIAQEVVVEASPLDTKDDAGNQQDKEVEKEEVENLPEENVTSDSPSPSNEDKPKSVVRNKARNTYLKSRTP